MNYGHLNKETCKASTSTFPSHSIDKTQTIVDLKKRALNINCNNNQSSDAHSTKSVDSAKSVGANLHELRKSSSLTKAALYSYLNALHQRKQDILMNSLLITFFCLSPIAIVPIYYCIEASKHMKHKNYENVEFLLRRANYLNLTALIIGSVVYIGLLTVAAIVLFSFYNGQYKNCTHSAGSLFTN